MSIWAIIPVKHPDQAKSRLAPVLSASMRHAVSLRLLERTLQVVAAAPSVTRCVVISPASEPLALARQYGAMAVLDSAWQDKPSQTPEVETRLNAALSQAAGIADRSGASAVLALPSDLPDLHSQALEELVAALPEGPGIVLAPDRHAAGTNALLVRPPLALPFLFGPHSFERHRQAAEARGLCVAVYEHSAFGLDLDTPEDLAFLNEHQDTVDFATSPGLTQSGTEPADTLEKAAAPISQRRLRLGRRGAATRSGVRTAGSQR